MSENKNLEYFNGDAMASDVWQSKYAAEGEETADDMHHRLAKEFARIEVNNHYKEGSKKYNDKHHLLSNYGKSREFLSEDKIYNLFKDFKYIIPQGSIMYGLGIDKNISLSNCFVIDGAVDSYGGIMLTDQEQIQLMKRRGGVGHDISNLRPSETPVTNSAGTSTGAVSFMERFSNSTREVAQNGRRGALMLSIDINHPDIEEFAKIKEDLSKVTGANISIRLNKEFMKAVEDNKDYLLKFPCNDKMHLGQLASAQAASYNELFLIKDAQEGEVKYTKKIKAKELWNTIVEQARNNAEPGLLFWDNVLDYSPDGVYPSFSAISTNPCGEIPMGAYDSCRLMCLNLFSFVDNSFTDNAKINYKKLYEIAYEQQRLMDDLVDLELEAIEKIIDKIKSDDEPENIKRTELHLWEKIYATGKAGRRTGSGITALADMLAALGVKYDSDEALEITDKVMKTKMEAELDCTIDLSILRGSFEGWDKDKEYINATDYGLDITGNNSFYDFIITNFNNQFKRMYKHGRRNISWSTIAPTGSVSILCQTSSGCEPVFMPFYMRRKKINPNDKDSWVDFVDDNGDSWQEYPVLHSKFKDWCEKQTINQAYSGYIKEDGKIGGDFKTIKPDLNNEDHLDLLFASSPWYKSTANDINWEYRLKMQEVLQKYVSHSISSTLNLPENTSVDTVSQIYMKASQMGLKGVTLYVEGSRSGVLVSNDSKLKDEFSQHDAPKRPKELVSHAYITSVKGEKFNVIVGLLKDKPYEVFAFPSKNLKGEGIVVKQGKGEYDFIQLTNSNSTNRVLTDCMNDEQASVTRLISTGLRHGTKIDFLVDQLNKTNGDLTSFSKAISRILSKFVETKETGNCPECETGKLIMQEGCTKCNSCQYSKC